MTKGTGDARSYGRKPISLIILAILAASVFTTIIPKAAFAATGPSASMNLWSPHSDSSVDGTPVSVFTFSADATASAGLKSLEWDFDGDGTVDATTPVSGAPASVSGISTTHVYGTDNVYWPQVRAVDVNNDTSDWSRYSVGGSNVPLDVFWPPATITMLQWAPFVPNVGQPITFSASAFNHVGVQYFEWDLNGDGDPDAFTPASPSGAQNASSSTVYSFSGAIATYPQVRAIDNDGFVSDWDVYDIDGQPVKMIVGGTSVPTVTLNQWSPYSATGPDGLPSTSFTFSASASDASGIARLEWDFDGNGVVDATTPVSGAPTSVSDVTATHTYNAAGTWTPQVRAFNVNNLSSSWTAFLVGGSPVTLDTGAPTMHPTLNFSPRAPSDVGPDGNTATVFTFTATYSNNPVRFDWDFDGNGVVDATTTLPTTTHVYPVAGSYLPSVTVVDTWGTTEIAFPLNSSSQQEKVDVSSMPPTATMNLWGPYSATGPDGNKNTVFTFSASATAPGGVARLEWDFDGDGSVDATTPVSGAPASVSAVTKTFSYPLDGNYTPKVRVVDMSGQTSDWDAYNVGTTIPVLDIVTPAPIATMNQWSPFASTGPDGYTTTTFTLSAGATSVVGLDRIEWDFDGDGSVDATTQFNGELSASAATKTHIYSATGSYTPAVRAVDIDGRTSAWDPYNIGTAIPTLDVASPPSGNPPVANAGPNQIVVLGSTVALDGSASSPATSGDSLTYLWAQNNGPVSVVLNTPASVKPTFPASAVGEYTFQLKVFSSLGVQSNLSTVMVKVVSAPIATLNQWGPYSATGPDGTPTTVFTFSADAVAAGGITRLEWDFNGDGTVDATSAISGAPTSVTGVTKTFTYNASGTFTPKVRVVDAGNNVSAWDAYNVGTTIIQLDISTPAPTGDLYCGGYTIDQLIASGNYNVIDYRTATKKVTINGKDGNDLILGGNFGDVINGKKGDDCIIAGDGDDLINGQEGNDYIYGGKGNDIIHGQDGNDVIYGGPGNDVIYGDNGADVIYGGDGNDTIKGDNDNDSIDGGNGTDACDPGNGNNTVINCEDSPTIGTNVSVKSNFNSQKINSGNYVWFNSVMKLKSEAPTNSNLAIHLTNQIITLNLADGTTLNLDAPDSTIVFSPSATKGTTVFDAANNEWVTTVPANFDDNVFLGGLAYKVPSGVSLAGATVTWSGSFNGSASYSVAWQFAAAVYTNFGDYNSIGVKPLHSKSLDNYPNGDQAGTPENFKKYVTAGARGGGGSNYTGSYSDTVSLSFAPQ